MSVVIYTTVDGKAYTAGDGTLLVISPPMALITDRTAADFVRWLTLRNKGYANMTEDERTEWDAGDMKGAYNPQTDMNRVGEALNYVRDRLAANGYLSALAFTAKTDWTDRDIPTPKALTEYLGYVSTVRGAFVVLPTTPSVPVYSGGLDYQEANNIEQILLDVDRLISNMLAARFYCGELYSGEI